jgi:hypothetical protein
LAGASLAAGAIDAVALVRGFVIAAGLGIGAHFFALAY